MGGPGSGPRPGQGRKGSNTRLNSAFKGSGVKASRKYKGPGSKSITKLFRHSQMTPGGNYSTRKSAYAEVKRTRAEGTNVGAAIRIGTKSHSRKK